MENLTSKFGFVSLDASPLRLPILTHQTGPDAVWGLISDNAYANRYTVTRAHYDVSKPYRPEGVDNPKMTRVDVSNIGDRLFRMGSSTHVDYLRHDMSVVETLRMPHSHLDLRSLIVRINTYSNTKLTELDFNIEETVLDDGIWTLKAASDSYFFAPDTIGVLYDRGAWDSISSWFTTGNVPDLKLITLDLTVPTIDVIPQLVASVRKDFGRPIPWDDVFFSEITEGDGEREFTVDRKPLRTLIDPMLFKYTPMVLEDYMQSSGSAKSGVLPYDRKFRLGLDTSQLFRDSPNAGSPTTGTGGYVDGKFFIDTINLSYNRINVPVDMAGPDWSRMGGQMVKVSFISTYRKGAYWFKLGGEIPQIASYGAGSTPEVDLSKIPGIGMDESSVPLFFEYFIKPAVEGRQAIVAFINGIEIYNGPMMQSFNESGGSTVVNKLLLCGTGNGQAPHSRLEIKDFNLYAMPTDSDIVSSYFEVQNSVSGITEGTIHDNLSAINDHHKTHLTVDNILDGSISETGPTEIISAEGDPIIVGGTSYTVDPSPGMDSVFSNTTLDGFDGYEVTGPGQQVSYIGYEYPDGRHTRYMGRVDDTEFFTPQEVMEAVVGDSGITYQIPYSTTQWFKYQLDGDIVYVPMKPLANHISYNELKTLGVVNRSGDHLARVNVNIVGNYKAGIKPDYRSKIIHKDGRAYAVRMIKGLNKDGPMLPFVNYDSDDTWTHDSEWNRMFYNLARQTILPAGFGDIHASQKGPKWEFISAADLVVENNGSDARYTLAPEFTIESSGAKPIYRGCYGVSVRGREAQGSDSPTAIVGFRPMLKYLPALETELKLSVEDRSGFKIINFHPDTDFDYCHDVKIYLRKPNEEYFKPIPFHSVIDDIPIIITEDMVDGDIYFTHSDTINTYRTEVLSLDIVTLGGDIDLSIMGPGPKVPLRLHSSNDDEELIIGYFGTLTQEEFITPEQFRNLTGLSAGKVKDCGLWMKFMYDGDICYMPQRALTSELNMVSVIDAGLRSGKVFHMDGQEFSARVPRGTRYHDIVKYSNKSSTVDKETSNQSYQECSEWKELMYRVLDWKSEGSNDSRASDVKPVTADDQWDLMSYSELELADNATTGNYNYAFERYGFNQDNGHMYLGVFGVSRFSHYDNVLTTTTPSYRLGLRPIVYLNRNALKSTSQGTRIQRADGGAWTNHSNNLLAPNRAIYSSFVYGDRQYLMYGGNSPAMHVSKEWWSPTNRKTLSNFPSFRHGATATLVGDLVYIIGGRTTLNTANVYNRKLGIYDPLRDTYGETIDLGIDICFHSATAVDGKIYIFGGHDTLGPDGNQTHPAPGFNGKNFYIYDTVTGTLEDRSDIEGLPTMFRQYSQYYDGKIYLFAGGSGQTGGATPDNLFIYDIESDIVSTVPNPLKGLVYTYMLSRMENVYGRWMYLLGGYGGGAITNLCYRIDLKTMTYSKLTNLPGPKANTRPVIINGQYFVSAGWNGSGTTPIYRMGTAFNLDT